MRRYLFSVERKPSAELQPAQKAAAFFDGNGLAPSRPIQHNSGWSARIEIVAPEGLSHTDALDLLLGALMHGSAGQPVSVENR